MRFVVFCHRNSILSQWKESSELLGLKIENLAEAIEQKRGDSLPDGWVLTYQGAAKQLNALKGLPQIFTNEKLLAIADEAHHLGVDPEEPENAIWGKTFLELTKNSSLRIGLTGTPFRADNLAFCSARKVRVQTKGELIEQITPDLSVEPRELIAAGDVRPLEFHFQDGWVEHSYEGHPDREVSSLSQEKRETWRARNLRRAIKLSDSSCIAVQVLLRASKKLEKIRSLHKNAGGLVIARDIEHATAIANLLQENGDSVELVHSQDKEASERLRVFQTHESKWLVSVDMCSEGFNAPRLRVVAYLTTVLTKSRFLQAITRTVRISNSRTSLETVPREPSHVFAPADPLLMAYARTWSSSKPYLIKGNEPETSTECLSYISKGPILPLETVGDGAGKVIKMRTAELPNFLKG